MEQLALSFEERLENANNYHNVYVRPKDYWSCLACKETSGWRQRLFLNKQIDISLFRNWIVIPNVYQSENDFYIPRRRVDCVSNLYALYSDLDYYRVPEYKNHSAEAILGCIEDDLVSDNRIPAPSLVIDSGRGIYLKWLLDPPLGYKSMPRWQRMQDFLNEALSEYGADRLACDAARVLRIPGTINSTSGTVVSVIGGYDRIVKYDFEYLEREYLPEKFTILLPPVEARPPAKKKRKQSSVKYIYNIHTLNWARLQDLVTLCKMRLWDLGSEQLSELKRTGAAAHGGLREFVLFLYRYWSCHYVRDPERALEMTLDLNSQFTEPLARSEVISATRSAEKAYLEFVEALESEERPKQKYAYRNSTLIKLLRITREEERKLQTIISTEEKYSRKNNKRNSKRRNAAGKTRRQETKDITLQRLEEALRENPRATSKDLSKIIGLSANYIRNLKKEINFTMCSRNGSLY